MKTGAKGSAPYYYFLIDSEAGGSNRNQNKNFLFFSLFSLDIPLNEWYNKDS